MSDNTNRILKADAARGLGATILFNYDDLKHRCRLYVEQVRQRAGQMIADARAESEAIRQRAFEEAKTAGLREAMQQVESDIETRAACLAEQKVAEQLETLLPAMRQASDELTREYDRWLADWEESAAPLKSHHCICAAFAIFFRRRAGGGCRFPIPIGGSPRLVDQ